MVGWDRMWPVISVATPTGARASLGRPVKDVRQLGAGAAAQQRPLVGLDDPQLCLVHGLPVVLQDAAGIAGVGVPGPVPVADPVCLQVGDECPLPRAFDVPPDGPGA